jgi:hypothetical protein
MSLTVSENGGKIPSRSMQELKKSVVQDQPEHILKLIKTSTAST